MRRPPTTTTPPGSSPRSARPLFGGRSLACLAVAGLLAVSGCGPDAMGTGRPNGAKAPDLPPVEVHVGPVGTATAPREVRAQGTFFPDDEVTVAAEAAGRVLEIGPEVGERVPPGALLARLDAREATLVRDQRGRGLAEVLTKLGLDALPEGEVDFESLPSVEGARLQASLAKARYERAQRLRERTAGTVSEQDVSDLRMAWEIGESGVRAARLNASTDLAQARTRAAELALASKRVADAEHRAPTGASQWAVAQRSVAVGDYVSVGTPLYRLLETDPLRLRVRVPERRMEGVVPGRLVTIETAGASGPTTGKVLRIRPEVDVRTRTYEVEVEVSNPEGRLPAGGFATAVVRVGEDEAVLVVPRAAVVTFAGVTKVFAPVEGRATERRITLGRRLGEAIEVVEGLAVGDAIVLDPPADLVAGTPLKVLPPAAAGP